MVNNFNQLYYKNSYLSEFEAEIIDRKINGEEKWLSLSQTCFYPEGGGQPGDKGVLSDTGDLSLTINVIDTIWNANQIWHQVDKLLPIGNKVKGKINFAYRYDLMQQHSGEHIISGIVNRDYGYKNVGFNINDKETTFDFDGDLSWKQIETIEEEANQAVTDNLDIEIHYLTAEEEKEWDYRSKFSLNDQIRLVVVPEFDVCACAGTHVKKTGEIGQIKIIKRESYKGGVRLTVLCGQRSLRYHQMLVRTVRQAGEMLSANPQNLTQNIQQRIDEVSDLKEEIKQKNKSWLELFMKNIEPSTENIILTNQPFNKNEWLYLAKNISSQLPGFVCFLKRVSEDKFLLFMYSDKLNLKEYIPLLREQVSFQGGGNANTIQGSIKGDLNQIEEIIDKLV